MKKRLCVMLSLVMIFCTSFCFNAFGVQNTDIEKTQIGTSDTYYEYDASSKTLTISGTGAIPDMKDMEGYQPWYDWRSDGSIEHVVVQEGITSIGAYCFISVKANNFTIPQSIKTIGRYAFSSSSIQSIDLPFGLTSLGANAFDACTELESVTLPDTLKTIGNYAFRLCVLLENIEIPHSVTSIGTYAFDRCNALKTAVFSDMTATVSIGTYAFYDCALLNNVHFPSNASVGKKAYGFGRAGAISSAKMYVYSSSKAHIYAETNSVPFELIDETYPLELGVPNSVSFDENTLDKVYTFTFEPSVTGIYNFYSRGDIDLKAALCSGNTIISENDDISDSDRNFCVTAELTAGNTYIYKIQSMREQGSATVVVYPDVIESFDVVGSLTFSAADGFHSSNTAYFPIVDSSLSDFVLDVHFEGGYSDKITYSAGYFDNKQIRLVDTQNQQPFTCGENAEIIAIGSVTATFPVYVTHEYTKTVVPYTAYEDGYTEYTCILCGDSYRTDFVPSPAVTVSGRCMLATHPDGSYSSVHPLSNSTVTFHGNTYQTDENGCFYFRTFLSGEIIISNPYCDSVCLEVIENQDADFGVIAMPAYDFNRDGYVNGRDLAKFKTELQDELGSDYFRYAVNFM
ncbi:MAG: leucine-rich repeat domain-containing protein [Eubacterium sp.]|nr:leucine-rich repeat domain-containing protein [Eubacterium sp.]